MHKVEAIVYRKAFIEYLRKGTPIEISLKAAVTERSTTHYIWRTRGDNKVRSSHAANNGKIFAWDNPPETGHPGEDYGCRCVAEPYTWIIPAQLSQDLYNLLLDFRNLLLDYLAITKPWGNFEMSLYFFLSNGEGVTLDMIGHSAMIRDYYIKNYLYRFEKQLIEKATLAPNGKFNDDFDASYDFFEVLYSYRDSRIIGQFTGEIIQDSSGTRTLQGKMTFAFEDSFKDPINFAQLVTNLNNLAPFLDPMREEDLYQWFREVADLWQKPYAITGGWQIDYRTPL